MPSLFFLFTGFLTTSLIDRDPLKNLDSSFIFLAFYIQYQRNFFIQCFHPLCKTARFTLTNQPEGFAHDFIGPSHPHL